MAFWNWRRGRWETTNLAEAAELKHEQPNPVYILNRETNTYMEYKERSKRRSLKMKNGKFVDTVGYYEDDIWD